MKISFATPKLEQTANNYDKLAKLVSKQKAHCTADDVLEQLNVLAAADSMAEIPPTLHPHPLKGKLKGRFAVDVSKTHRIIFRSDHEGDPEFRIDNRNTIKRIVIEQLCFNYHGH